MNDPTQLSIYQLRAVLNGVLLSIETSLADLHKILQLSFGWSGFYLYEFCDNRVGIDLEELEDATHRVEAYLRFRDRKFDRQKLNRKLSELNRNGAAQ